MTNERAVEILNLDLDILGQYGDETAEAYKMAIQALDAQPCEDCISREEAKKFLYEEIEQLHDDGLYDCFSRIIDDMYNELPSVTPRINLAETSQDCISRQKALDCFEQTNTRQGAKYAIEKLPSVTPQTVTEFADKCKECGKIQNKFFNFDAPMAKNSDAVSREAVIRLVEQYPNIIGNRCSGLISDIKHLPSVKPKYTDEEIDKAQAVEQAYVDKMVELAVEESRREWLNSFDTNSATECFTAVNILKERLEHEET